MLVLKNTHPLIVTSVGGFGGSWAAICLVRQPNGKIPFYTGIRTCKDLKVGELSDERREAPRRIGTWFGVSDAMLPLLCLCVGWPETGQYPFCVVPGGGHFRQKVPEATQNVQNKRRTYYGQTLSVNKGRLLIPKYSADISVGILSVHQNGISGIIYRV